MNWKFAGDRPVYQQIMAAIRGAILKGELPPGGKVPSVRDLAAQAQVNPNTMQRALTELEREGLLVSGGTSGRSVTPGRSRSRRHAGADAGGTRPGMCREIYDVRRSANTGGSAFAGSGNEEGGITWNKLF